MASDVAASPIAGCVPGLTKGAAPQKAAGGSGGRGGFPLARPDIRQEPQSVALVLGRVAHRHAPLPLPVAGNRVAVRRGARGVRSSAVVILHLA
jgi:hypothetical protein